MPRRRNGIAGRLLVVILVVLGIPLGGLGLYWLITLPDVAVLAKVNPPSTALIDAREREAQERPGRWRRRQIWVPLSRISPHLQRAVIVAEDAAFYRHEGFDWDGIREAVRRNLQAGRLVRGGSTITQQLAKNLYLSSEKNWLRKANEAVITRLLEHHLTKKRILELYLNVAEWGDGVFGAEAAARHHFGKSAADLTMQEAALLAAVLPAPRRHDPLRLTPHLVKRQHAILSWMGRRDGTTGARPISRRSTAAGRAVGPATNEQRVSAR